MKRNYEHLNALAENLGSISADLSDCFACPVCLRVLPKAAYDEKKITHAHVVPKKIEAGPYTLACDECNSRAGSMQDRHLIEYARVAWPKSNDEQPIGVRVKINGDTVRAELRPERSRFHRLIRIAIGNSNNRDALRRIDGHLARRPASIAATVRFNFDPSMVQCALLTAAYLNAFRLMGYWYVLNANLDPIRAEIVNPRSEGIARRAVFQLESRVAPTPETFLVIEPSRLRSVIFRYQDRMVLLPYADDRGLRIYDEMEAFLSISARLDVTPEPFTSLVELPRGRRVGPITADRGGEVVAIYAYPDLKTVTRVLPPGHAALPWVSEAPPWVPGWAHAGDCN